MGARGRSHTKQYKQRAYLELHLSLTTRGPSRLSDFKIPLKPLATVQITLAKTLPKVYFVFFLDRAQSRRRRAPRGNADDVSLLNTELSKFFLWSQTA